MSGTSTAKMIKGVVAKGRSLMAGGEPMLDSNGFAIGPTTEARHYMPGEEVYLSEKDFREAVAHGFIVDPDAPIPTYNTGPKIQVTGETQMVGRVEREQPTFGRMPDAPR